MFTPRPNVDSAVVRLTVLDGRLPVKDAQLYKKTVHAAFAARRKTLVNNLVNVFGISRAQAEEALIKCGIAVKTRGEALSPEAFARLSAVLADYTAPERRD